MNYIKFRKVVTEEELCEFFDKRLTKLGVFRELQCIDDASSGFIRESYEAGFIDYNFTGENGGQFHVSNWAGETVEVLLRLISTSGPGVLKLTVTNINEVKYTLEGFMGQNHDPYILFTIVDPRPYTIAADLYNKCPILVKDIFTSDDEDFNLETWDIVCDAPMSVELLTKVQ